MLRQHWRRVGQRMRDQDIVVLHNRVQILIRLLHERHHQVADEVLSAPKWIHDLPHNVALSGIDVRSNRVTLEPSGFDVREVVAGKRKHDIVAASDECAAESDVRVQVTKGPERVDDEFQRAWDVGSNDCRATKLVRHTDSARNWYRRVSTTCRLS